MMAGTCGIGPQLKRRKSPFFISRMHILGAWVLQLKLAPRKSSSGLPAGGLVARSRIGSVSVRAFADVSMEELYCYRFDDGVSDALCCVQFGRFFRSHRLLVALVEICHGSSPSAGAVFGPGFTV